MRKRIASLLVVAMIVVGVFGAVTAQASWAHCHASQGIHELSNPPAGWPGTRAAHTVSYYQGMSNQTFYTKSGWWDPTWDYYKYDFWVC